VILIKNKSTIDFKLRILKSYKNYKSFSVYSFILSLNYVVFKEKELRTVKAKKKIKKEMLVRSSKPLFSCSKKTIKTPLYKNMF